MVSAVPALVATNNSIVRIKIPVLLQHELRGVFGTRENKSRVMAVADMRLVPNGSSCPGRDSQTRSSKSFVFCCARKLVAALSVCMGATSLCPVLSVLKYNYTTVQLLLSRGPRATPPSSILEDFASLPRSVASLPDTVLQSPRRSYAHYVYATPQLAGHCAFRPMESTTRRPFPKPARKPFVSFGVLRFVSRAI